MPWINGTYVRTDGTRTGADVWKQSEAAGFGIESADADTHDQDMATAINQCLTRDGSNSATADMNMGGHKMNNMGAGILPGDAMQYGQYFQTGDRLLSAGPVPNGWTRDTTQNNKTLRVVNTVAGGVGGSRTFSATFTSRTPAGTVDNHALTVDEMPIHNHAVTDPGHKHPYVKGNIGTSGGSGGTDWYSTVTADTSPATTGISIVNAGGGLAHGHTMSMSPMDFDIQYVDVNIIIKD